MSSPSWSNRTITTTAFGPLPAQRRLLGLCQLALSYDGKCAHHHITPSRSNRTNTNNGIRDFGAESNRTRSPSSPRGLIVQRFRNKTFHASCLERHPPIHTDNRACMSWSCKDDKQQHAEFTNHNAGPSRNISK